MKKRLIFLIGILTLIFSFIGFVNDPLPEANAFQGLSMVLKIDSIDGESKVDGAKGDIDVLAWSWGMSQSGSLHAGGQVRESQLNVQDLSLTKYIDKASTDLMLACLKGVHLKKATLTIRKPGDRPLNYIEITMSPVIVTSISTGGSGGEDRLTENVTLNFSKVEVSYMPQKADGSADAVKDLAWNIQKNREE